MPEEKKTSSSKQIKTVLVGDEDLPTHYVNSVNIRSDLEAFFLTFGTALPIEISNMNELENIESIKAHSLFRCVISRSVMKQVIDLMTTLYENQTEQIKLIQASQRKDEEYVNYSDRPSEP